MNNEIKNMNLGEVINSAMEGPYGPLAIAVIGIAVVFSIYMSHTTAPLVTLDLA